MKVDNFGNKLGFTGAIIDSHMHVGNWPRNGNRNDMLHFDKSSIDTFTRTPLNVNIQGQPQQDEVVKVIFSNLNALYAEGKDELEGNREILSICEKDSKYYALAACQPSKTEGNAVKINNLIQENPGKFVGLKFHPRSFGAQADSEIYQSYMFLADRYKLPCLFHCDVQVKPDGKLVDKISSPEAIHNLARKFPNVPVIMGHMGAGDAKSHQNAIDELLKSIDDRDSRLYVDISWVDWGKDGQSNTNKPSIVKLIKELQKRNATDRILFGTDAPLGCFGETPSNGLNPKQAYEKVVGDLKTVIKENFKDQADDLIDKIFYKNADNLFFKKDWAISETKKVKNTPIIKILGMVAGVLALIGLGGVLMDKMSAKENNVNK